MIVTPIPTEELDEHWPALTHFLADAITFSCGDLTLEGIKQRAYDGDELIVAVFDRDKIVACCTLALIDFETGKKVLQMVVAGGSQMGVWRDEGFNVIRNIAKAYGCTHIRGCGRPGWERALPVLKKIRTVYECEV